MDSNAHEGAKARPRECRPRSPRARAFWVMFGGDTNLPCAVGLPDGRKAMALFSGELEANMFRRLCRGEGTGLRVRKTPTGEVLSLLYDPRTAKRHVVLDPFPEVMDSGLLELLTLSRGRFARCLGGAEVAP